MGRGTGIRRMWPRLPLAGLAILLAIAVLGAVAPAGKAYIFWTDNGPGEAGSGTTLERANNDGRGLKASLVKNASGPTGIVVDGNYIYWANSNTDSIGRATIAGAGANPKFISPGAAVVSLTIDGQYIYFVESGNDIGRVKLNGTDSDPGCITAAEPVSVAAYGGMLYIGETGRIDHVIPTCGDTPTLYLTLSKSSASADGLAFADGNIYWSEFIFGQASSIGRAALSNPSSPDESFVPNLFAPTGVAVGGGYLYWVDHEGGPSGNGAIGREPLSAQNPNDDYISDSRGPSDVAADANIDPTSTSVTCTPTRVAKNSSTVCTAVVHDSASSELPTGTVLFHGPTSVFFPGGNSCTLGKHAGGGASCTVGAEATVTGKHTIVAAYRGDPTHHASSGSATFCAGSKTMCK